MSAGERQHLMHEAEITLAKDLAAHVLILRQCVSLIKGESSGRRRDRAYGSGRCGRGAKTGNRRRRGMAKPISVDAAQISRPGMTERECGRPVQRYPGLLEPVGADDANVRVTLGDLDHALEAFREEPVIGVEDLRVLALGRDLAESYGLRFRSGRRRVLRSEHASAGRAPRSSRAISSVPSVSSCRRSTYSQFS